MDRLYIHLHKKEKKMTVEGIKYGFIAIVTSIFAFLDPIAGDLYSMLLLFCANALFGIIADIVVGKSWNKKKFQQAFVEALLFFIFVCMIYSIGFLKKNMDGALQCVSFVSYSLVYYYGTNTCRNMMNILPAESLGHKVFCFIYSVLSVEFVKHIPYLQDYLNNKEYENKG